MSAISWDPYRIRPVVDAIVVERARQEDIGQAKRAGGIDWRSCADPEMNGGDFARRIGFAVPISGIKTTGVVRCDQPRVLDLAARTARKVDTLPAPILDEVLAKVATLFQ